MLDHIWGWYAQTCNPIVDDYYGGKHAEALSELAQSKAELESLEIDDDDRMAMTIALDYLEYSLYEAAGNFAEAVPAAEKLMAELAAPLHYTYAEIMRRRCLLSVLLAADIKGRRSVGVDTVKELLSGIPRDDRLGDFYIHIALWAYKHRHLRYLDLARDDILINGLDFKDTFIWHRIDLMRWLLDQKADPVHVISLIESADTLDDLEAFRKYLWHDCQEAGIVTPEVEQAYTKWHAELSQPPAIGSAQA